MSAAFVLAVVAVLAITAAVALTARNGWDVHRGRRLDGGRLTTPIVLCVVAQAACIAALVLERTT